MRKAMFALTVLAVLGVALTAWAKDPNKVRDPNRAAKKRKNVAEAALPPAPAPVELKGAVVKAEANEITVTVTLPVDAAAAKVMIGGVAKALADLKPGQAVTITLDGGKATRIEAAEGKEPGKAF